MFEDQLANSMFSGSREKSFIDKLLAREDTDRLRELVKKPKWKREELLEVLYLLGSTESKLLNYGEWDRYVILKFFVWIREFIKVAELLFDYQEDLVKKETYCKRCGGWTITDANNTKKCVCEKPDVFVISDRTRQLLYNNERLIEHNAKFLIDLYLNIGRTTLSIGGTGLLELLKNKYEVAYPQQNSISTPQQPASTGWLAKLKGG